MYALINISNQMLRYSAFDMEGEIRGDGITGRVDLSGIDFEKLAKLFETRPRTAAEKMNPQGV